MSAQPRRSISTDWCATISCARNHGRRDIAVQILPKQERKRSSHEVAMEVREMLTPIAKAAGARLTVAEAPPGPPVLALDGRRSLWPDGRNPPPGCRRSDAHHAGHAGRGRHQHLHGSPIPEIAFEVDRLHAAMHRYQRRGHQPRGDHGHGRLRGRPGQAGPRAGADHRSCCRCRWPCAPTWAICSSCRCVPQRA